jgi:peptide subunit release factor 1 (eRF1)
MAGTTTARGRLRRLADLRPAHGRVLSVYFDLDPSVFATGDARASQITSVTDEAGKLVEQRRDEFDHDELVALREDVERIRGAFDPQTMGQGGARGLAVFACGPADLFEVVRLPHPIDTRVTIGDSPEVGPLVSDGERERWCVVLVSSRDGRVFAGDEGGFEDLGNVYDDTHGQHRQGGWSHRRYQNSIDEDRKTHLKRVSDELLALLRQRPFDRLLIGGPEPLDDEFEAVLHPYLAERLAGRVSIDVDTANAASVLEAATPVFREHRTAHEREALERLRASLGRGDGRAVAGREDVADALVQRRVEILLLEPRAEDVEELVEQAIDGSAEVLVVDDETPDLSPHGGIAAVLRF